MEFIIDFTEAADTLVTGTVRPAGGTTRFTFSGHLELLARLEQLRLPSDAVAPLSATHPNEKGIIQ
jgi:hypothetical protein